MPSLVPRKRSWALGARRFRRQLPFPGVLPALAFPTQAQAITYIGGFAAGTIVAMACFGARIDWIGRRFSFGGERVCRGLMATFASAAIGIGGFWLATS